LSDLHDFVRVLDEVVRQLADVNEPVLMHSDVYKSAEGGNISHDAGQFHANGEVLRFFDAFDK
jgi:hypothetical protein